MNDPNGTDMLKNFNCEKYTDWKRMICNRLRGIMFRILFCVNVGIKPTKQENTFLIDLKWLRHKYIVV